MPELPEVETVKRGLAPVMTGRRLATVEQRRPDLRFPFPENFAARLSGRRILALGRRAKYLLADLDDGTVLVMHLGMSGSFRVNGPELVRTPGAFHHPRGKREAHDHVVFHLDDRTTVTYNDPRRFGYMMLVERSRFDEHPKFRDLGIEPLGNELSPAWLAAAFAGRRATLKFVLIGKQPIAGLGNIYVCEILWRAGLSPLRPAGTIAFGGDGPDAPAVRLAAAIRAVLEEAIAAGGSSLRDHVRTDGTLGDFQHSFAVYGREGALCPRPACRGTIARIVQYNRSTFYCPACQR